MVESISELRKICRKTTSTYSNEVAVQPFFYIKFLRFFSIYFVKLGIMLNMTPNQMTFVSMILAIIAGILFSFADPIYWMVGCLLLILFSIVDCADGELARYLKRRSPIGRYFDLWVHGVESSSVFTGVTFGLYKTINNPFVFVLGFITMICTLLTAYSGALRNYHLADYALNSNDKNIFKNKDSAFKKRLVIKPFINISYYALKQIFSFFTIPYIILLMILLDFLFKPVLINIEGINLLINWRFLFLLLFTIITPLKLINDVRNTLKLNEKLNLSKVNE